MDFRKISFTRDAAKTIKGKFKPSAQAERQFYRQLKKVAQASAHIVERHIPTVSHPHDLVRMQEELKRYSEALTPWAERQSNRLLEQVQKSNKRAYTNKSKAMGKLLNANLVEGKVAPVALGLMVEQVELIKSIPLEAGLRAQKIAYEAVLLGTRAEASAEKIQDLADELGLTEEVTISRALLIARTETARANASINQSRAMAVGSGQYRWHNSGDGNVRHSHMYLKGKKLQGQIFSWDSPPTLDDGMTGHPGTFPNCRCFAEPIFGDE